MPAKGPYLVAAFFCENVLFEQDGVITAVRIIDRIFVQRIATEKKEGEVAEVVQINLFVSLKGGGYVGKGKLKMFPVSPSGKELKTQETEVELPAQPNAGVNLVIRGLLAFREEGVYWFRIYFNDELITQTPLDVQLMTPEMLQSLPGGAPGKAAPAPDKRA
jgi:hypothetical protein